MVVWVEAPFDNLPAEGFRPQRYWLMARAFAAAGHRVTYWTADFNHGTKAVRRLSGADERGVALRLVPTPPYRRNVGLARILSHRAYARRWERMATDEVSAGRLERPNLIVCALPMIGTAAVAMRFRRAWGCRFALDIQDAWPETFYRLAPRGFRWAAKLALLPLRRAARAAYRGADLVTGVCDRYGELARGYGARGFSRAYHGISLAGAPQPAKRPAGGVTRLVYAGNLGRTYDLATAIRAVRANPSLALDIAGKGPCEAKWRHLASGADNVRFHGYLDAAGLAALLAAADVGVVPMAPESFVGVPYKFADYALAGLAIVSSLGGESAALLARYGCGADYRAGDADGFAAAVASLVPRLGEAGAAARRMAETEFDAAAIYADYVKHVEETLK